MSLPKSSLAKIFRWLFLLDRQSVITLSNTQLSFRHIPHPFGILQADTVDMEAIWHIQSITFQHSFPHAPKARVILADVPSILLNSLFCRTESTAPVNNLLMSTIFVRQPN